MTGSAGFRQGLQNTGSAHLCAVDLLTIEHGLPCGLHTPGFGLKERTLRYIPPKLATTTSSASPTPCQTPKAQGLILSAVKPQTATAWLPPPGPSMGSRCCSEPKPGAGAQSPAQAKRLFLGSSERVTLNGQASGSSQVTHNPHGHGRESISGGRGGQYQVHQQVHNLLRHQILGVIHQNVAMVGVEV